MGFRSSNLPLSLGAWTSCLAFLAACGSSQGGPIQSDEQSPEASSGGNSGENIGVGGNGQRDGSGGTGSRSNKDDIAFPEGLGGGGRGMGTGGSRISVTDNCARTEVTAVDTTIVQPADIMILVDSSPSMLEEIGFVRENLNAFSRQISDSGVDARVIMIAEPMPDGATESEQDTVTGMCIDPPLGSGSCPEDSNLPKYVHIPQAVGSTNSLDVFTRTSAEWKEHVRPEAVRSVFIISDDDVYYPQAVVSGSPSLAEDLDYMSSSFLESFERLDPDFVQPWSINAVYPFTECSVADGVGLLYARLIEETNGIAGDLCEQDFQPVFDRLAARVVDDSVALSCEWDLPDPVEGQTFSTELVQVLRSSAGNVQQELFQVPTVADCAQGAWHFDNPINPKRILACPQTCDAISDDTEGRIDVEFACEIVEGCSASGTSALESVPVDDSDSPAVACQWMMPTAASGNVVDLKSLNVRYVTESGFGILLGQAESASACAVVDQGWYYDDPEEPTAIVACPSTCETLQVADVTGVEALFGCETKPAVIR